jgi:hypothetical protein
LEHQFQAKGKTMHSKQCKHLAMQPCLYCSMNALNFHHFVAGCYQKDLEDLEDLHDPILVRNGLNKGNAARRSGMRAFP